MKVHANFIKVTGHVRKVRFLTLANRLLFYDLTATLLRVATVIK